MGHNSEQPLSVLEISEYAAKFHFKGDFRFFFRVIKAMDRVERKYRAEVRDRQSTAAKRAKSKQPKKR